MNSKYLWKVILENSFIKPVFNGTALHNTSLPVTLFIESAKTALNNKQEGTMPKTIPLETLRTTAQAVLIKSFFSRKSISNFKREWGKFFQFATRTGAVDYTSNLAEAYLRYRCGRDICDTIPITSQERIILRHIKGLDDVVMFGHIRHGGTKANALPAGFEDAARSYFNEYKGRLSTATLRIYKGHLHKFATFLYESGVLSCQDIQSGHISSYIRTFVGYDQCTIHVRLCSLRSFLRFFFEAGHHHQDLSVTIPIFRTVNDRHVQTTWEPEEIKAIIACIDRGNPTGQRDYAIVIMAVMLGMRVGDIRDLKFSDIDWETKTIRYTQNKNQLTQELPLLDEVGWALITYLQNGRPQSDSEYVFVRHLPPYGHFSEHSSFWYLIQKYIPLAGLKAKKRSGLHSLRHSLASNLLKQQAPLPVISGILGHADVKSTNVYLKVDISMLRKCALSLGKEGGSDVC
jgi:site-specific recombinase XerD